MTLAYYTLRFCGRRRLDLEGFFAWRTSFTLLSAPLSLEPSACAHPNHSVTLFLRAEVQYSDLSLYLTLYESFGGAELNVDSLKFSGGSAFRDVSRRIWLKNILDVC
jgi:hypothetical protein